MSKSIGKILGAGNASTSMYGSEKNILNYLNQYDIYHYKTNGCQIHYLTYGIDFFGRMTISVNNNKSSEYLWVGTK